jgi:hypothetical protein
MSENSKNETAQPQVNRRVLWRTLTSEAGPTVSPHREHAGVTLSLMSPSLSRLAQGVHEGRQHEGAIRELRSTRQSAYMISGCVREV